MTDLPDRVLAILEREPMTMLELCEAVEASRTRIWSIVTQLELMGRVTHTKLPGKKGEHLYRAKPRPTPSFAKSSISREQLRQEREASRKRTGGHIGVGRHPMVRGPAVSGAWAGPFRLHMIFQEDAA